MSLQNTAEGHGTLQQRDAHYQWYEEWYRVAVSVVRYSASAACERHNAHAGGAHNSCARICGERCLSYSSLQPAAAAANGMPNKNLFVRSLTLPLDLSASQQNFPDLGLLSGQTTRTAFRTKIELNIELIEASS